VGGSGKRERHALGRVKDKLANVALSGKEKLARSCCEAWCSAVSQGMHRSNNGASVGVGKQINTRLTSNAAAPLAHHSGTSTDMLTQILVGKMSIGQSILVMDNWSN